MDRQRVSARASAAGAVQRVARAAGARVCRRRSHSRHRRGVDAERLRYPVGPDAIPLLQWRASVSDEDFVARGALDDESWCQLMEATTGLPIRKYLFEPV